MKDDKWHLAFASLCFVADSLLLACIYLRLFSAGGATLWCGGMFWIKDRTVQLVVWWPLLRPVGSPLHPVAAARTPQTFPALRQELLLGWARPQMTWPCSPVTWQIVSCRVLKTSPCLFIWSSGGMVANQSQPVMWLLAFCLIAWMKC